MSIKPREWNAPYRSWEHKKPKSKLTRGGGIKPVSAKRIKLNKVYSALRKSFLESHPWCELTVAQLGYDYAQVCKDNGKAFGPLGRFITFPRSEEVHHKRGRNKYLLDTTTWMAVSSEGHRWLHDNVKEAYEKGWMLPRN